MRHRIATLAAVLFAAAPAFAQKDPVTIDAQTIEGVSDLEVTARGAAQIKRGETAIFGEVLRYNRELGRVEGEGGVRLQHGVDRFFGPRLQFNTLDNTGVFEQPSYQLQREKPARGGADRLEFLGKDRYRLSNANFTTCRPGQEDWRLEAEQIDLDYEQDAGEAKNVRLRFFDTTILGSPWASFPLSDRRRSGLLPPYYAQTSQRGAEFGAPYYWNIAPERDMTFTPVYMARRGLQLKNLSRYLDSSYAGELRLEYLPEDRQADRSRDGQSWQHAQTFGPGIKAQVDYNRVSDSFYFVDLASQIRQLTVRNLPQDGNLSSSGMLSAAAPYSAQARFQRFQTLQDPLAPIAPPYHRVPQLKFTTGYHGMGGLVDSTLPAEYVRFSHPTDVQASRVAANPALAGAFAAPGWFVSPKVGLRAVGYAFERNPAGTKDEASLSIPWLSLDNGLVLERDSRWYGEPFTQTLEPRLFYLYVPYHSQDHIPLFDTALADFNYPQLFSENRFVGGDRFGDANQATLAVSSRFLHGDGQEAFRVTVGQRYHFKAQRVGLTPTSAVDRNTESDQLASVGGRVFKHWTFDSTAQYDRHDRRTERYNVSLRYSPRTARVVNFAYRFAHADVDRDAIRQLDASSQWPLAAGWYGVGRYNYSLLDNRLLEGLAGIEYNAGCWIFRAVVQRIRAATQVSSTQLLFQLEFNGLGQLGTDEAVELLKRNVPGYSVTNPSDPTLAPQGSRPRLPFEQVY